MAVLSRWSLNYSFAVFQYNTLTKIGLDLGEKKVKNKKMLSLLNQKLGLQ